MIGDDEPSLAFFGSSFGNGEEDQRGAGIDPKTKLQELAK